MGATSAAVQHPQPAAGPPAVEPLGSLSRPRRRSLQVAPEPGEPNLRIRILGDLSISDPEGPVHVPGGRARVILEMLLAAAPSLVASDVIYDELWPDGPPLSADRIVGPLVSRLRRAIGTCRILGDGRGWRFDGEGCWVDTDELTRLEREARRQLGAGAPALASAAVDTSLRLLHRGEPFALSPYAEWAQPLRRHVAQLIRSLLRTGWSAAMTLGDHQRALDLAERAVTADPFDEEAWRAVLAALASDGRPATALARYEELRGYLAEELGASPTPETEALHLQLLTSEGPPPLQTGRVMEAPVPESCAVTSVRRALQDAASGRPRFVLITGGDRDDRSSLLEHVERNALGIGGQVLRARCSPVDRDVFLLPLTTMASQAVGWGPEVGEELRRTPYGSGLSYLLPELAVSLGGPLDPGCVPELTHRLALEAVLEPVRIAALRTTTVAIVDDLDRGGHWNAHALRLLALRATNERMLVVVTAASSSEAAELLADVVEVVEVDHPVTPRNERANRIRTLADADACQPAG